MEGLIIRIRRRKPKLCLPPFGLVPLTLFFSRTGKTTPLPPLRFVLLSPSFPLLSPHHNPRALLVCLWLCSLWFVSVRVCLTCTFTLCAPRHEHMPSQASRRWAGWVGPPARLDAPHDTGAACHTHARHTRPLALLWEGVGERRRLYLCPGAPSSLPSPHRQAALRWNKGAGGSRLPAPPTHAHCPARPSTAPRHPGHCLAHKHLAWGAWWAWWWVQK
jgi:hypothetical protein